ncbi:MAG: bifunctional diguanylate cyclase/phosphodiesterase [Leptolyngbya sp. SIO4C1]|nr:bifunctional diguanylate cyclase/phosphodiesterase [Leptolyngbya sp. SIO4C1]
MLIDLWRRVSTALNPFLLLCIVGGGWVTVGWHGYRLEVATIKTYQQAELEIVRNTARAAQVYITQELLHRGVAALPAIEQEVLKYFVAPLQIGTLGDAWIYSPDYVVFDQSADFPPEYVGKDMAEIFAIQTQHGARHYAAMTRSVMAGEEGTGKYVWEPDKAREATAWWEPLTRDSGFEIAAWTPVVVFPGTDQEQIWVIGLSAMLPELMQLEGAYRQINLSITVMGGITLSALSSCLHYQRRSRQTALAKSRQAAPSPGAPIPLRSPSQPLLKYETELEQLALTDFLTGLANRQQLYRIGNQVLEHWPADLSGIALLYIDLNQFKTVNDTLGHDVGDILLTKAGERLKTCLRENDLLSRLGSDEFAILLAPADAALAKQVAEQVVRVLKMPFYLSQQKIDLDGSLGIVLITEPGLSMSQLLTQADIALHRAKAGNQRFVLFDRAMQAAVIARSILENDLRQALENQELCLHYQPIVDLYSNQTVGFEALVRWQHPQRGLLSPNDFLAVANDIGLSLLIDRWVLLQACQQLTRWPVYSTSGALPAISVNLSGNHLEQTDLVGYIESILADHPVYPRQLTLEITEQVMIQQPEQAIRTLQRLRQLGMRISLDDFGTGYSSLSYLYQLPVDVLKIDRSFVSQLGKTEQSTAIIKTIISLARDLNIPVVAEGIEHFTQLRQLQQLQCHYGQGDFFSKPLDPLEVSQLIQRQAIGS